MKQNKPAAGGQRCFPPEKRAPVQKQKFSQTSLSFHSVHKKRKLVHDYDNRKKETMETWVGTLKSLAEFLSKLHTGNKINEKKIKKMLFTKPSKQLQPVAFPEIWRLDSPQFENDTSGKTKRRPAAVGNLQATLWDTEGRARASRQWNEHKLDL